MNPKFEAIKIRGAEKISNQIIKFQDKLYKLQAIEDEKVHWWDRLYLWLDRKLAAIGTGLAGTGYAVKAENPLIGWILIAVGLICGVVGGSNEIGKVQTKYGKKGEFGITHILQIIADIIKNIIKLLKGGQ